MKTIPFNETHAVGKLLMSAFQPENLPGHEPKFQVFDFSEPSVKDKGRAVAVLGITDLMAAQVQVLDKGGGEGMHLHAAMDGLWMVLKGRGSFLDGHGVEHEIGPMQGVIVPRGTAYAFKNVGDDHLVLLQVEALHANAKRNQFRMLDKSAGDSHSEYESYIDLYDARRDS